MKGLYNMQATKKMCALGLLCAALLSSVPIAQASATPSNITKIANKFSDPKYAVGLGLCLFTTYLLIDFWIRKPLKEPRFDKERLGNGTMKERLQHMWYYFKDTIIGWPYKGKKVICKVENGKAKLDVQEEQIPGGALGIFQGYVLVGAKNAVEWMIKEVGSVILIGVLVDAIASGKFYSMAERIAKAAEVRYLGKDCPPPCNSHPKCACSK